jgi:hypothetical protein
MAADKLAVDERGPASGRERLTGRPAGNYAGACVREAAAAGNTAPHADGSGAARASKARGRRPACDRSISVASHAACRNASGRGAPGRFHTATSAGHHGAVAVLGAAGHAAARNVGLSAGSFDFNPSAGAADRCASGGGFAPRTAGDGNRRAAGSLKRFAPADGVGEGGLGVIAEVPWRGRWPAASLVQEIIQLPWRGALKRLRATESAPRLPRSAETWLSGSSKAALRHLARGRSICDAATAPVRLRGCPAHRGSRERLGREPAAAEARLPIASASAAEIRGPGATTTAAAKAAPAGLGRRDEVRLADRENADECRE